MQYAHTGSALACEDDFVHPRVADNRQIVSSTTRFDVRIVRAHAHPITVVYRVGRNTEGTWCVVIWRPWITAIEGGFRQRMIHGAPQRNRRAINRYRPGITMIGLRAIAFIRL